MGKGKSLRSRFYRQKKTNSQQAAVVYIVNGFQISGEFLPFIKIGYSFLRVVDTE
jgi:sRNA-binding regulator protein Hfq